MGSLPRHSQGRLSESEPWSRPVSTEPPALAERKGRVVGTEESVLPPCGVLACAQGPFPRAEA